MKCVSYYGTITMADMGKDDELSCTENDCAGCLYQAARLSLYDVLNAVINNELSETEKRIIELHWFGNMSVKSIAAASGLSLAGIRKSLNRAHKKIEAILKYIVLYNEMLDGSKSVPRVQDIKISIVKNGKEFSTV